MNGLLTFTDPAAAAAAAAARAGNTDRQTDTGQSVFAASVRA